MDERCSRNPVPGPDSEGLSQVMGNSTAAWKRFYDLHRCVWWVVTAVGVAAL